MKSELRFKIFLTDFPFESLGIERELLERRKLENKVELAQAWCETPEEVIAAAGNPDVLLVHHAPITREVIEAMPGLKVIGRYGTGYDVVDLEAANENGVYLVNAPDYCVEEVSTHVIGLLISLVRKIGYLHNFIMDEKWENEDDFLRAGRISRLKGKKLGLIGFGRIGQRVAFKAQAFGLKILVYTKGFAEDPGADSGGEFDRRGIGHDKEGIKYDREEIKQDRRVIGHDREGIKYDRPGVECDREVIEHNRRVIEYDRPEVECDRLGVEYAGLEELLEKSDFVSLHLPLTAETEYLLGEREFSLMKSEALLINTSRGRIIREEELAAALEKGLIAGAALDVFAHEPLGRGHPLLNLDSRKVVFTPHSAFYSEESEMEVRKEVLAAALELLQGRKPDNLVNQEIWQDREDREG